MSVPEAISRNVTTILSKFAGVKACGRDRWLALCPCHDDHAPSLSICVRDDKVLFHCHAGCRTADIVAAVGLTMADLFLQEKAQPAQRQVVATYNYRDEEGRLLFQVVRYRPKGFVQRQPDGKGGWAYKLDKTRRVLYRLPEVIRAVKEGRTIFVVEGEKDVDRLKSLGFTATTNPMGAGKWRSSYADALQEADVVIIPDGDSAGRDHAGTVANFLCGRARQVRVLELPEKDVSDWLDGGGSAQDLARLAALCPVYGALPEVVVTGRHLRDITDEALKALYRANKPGRIFRRGGGLCRVSLDEKSRPFTEVLNESAFRGCLARAGNFVRMEGRESRLPVPPPLSVVRDCLSLGDWQFPPLLGVIEAPVMRPDGTVLTRPGYDRATNLYYFPSPKLKVPDILDRPEEHEFRAATRLALELFYDFPFDGPASRANALAALFTPILRPMIEGPVPLVIIDKPQAGTGASLLAEVISLVATGRPAAVMTQQKDDEGWRKAITSLLLKGQLVVTIDNIESTLWAPSLAAILTATSYQDRILGRSEMVTLPNHATWIGTGNNIRLAGDLPRRCIWVRLDAKTARPWLRDVKGFRHPHLVEWASAHRGAILAAILTIARAWVAAGRPEAHDLPNLGGYESYSQVVGGVLGFMGVDGFLGNLDALYDETDIDTPQWEGFLEAWRETIGETPVTAAELLMRLKSTAELHAALPDAIADTEAKNYIRRLGNALARKKGVRFPHGLSVNKVGEFRRAVKWQIVSPKNADSHQFSFKCESCESGMTRHAQGGQNDIKDEYIKGVKQDSQDSQLATKSVSLAPMPSCYGAPDDDFNPDNPEHVAKLERELDQYLEAGDEHGT